MIEFDDAPALAAIERAREADASIWSGEEPGLAHWRTARNGAVRDAVEAGIPLGRIADGLGVLVIDVERMAWSARPR